MKVLGISSGRTLGNAEILLREALAGAQQEGAAVELVRLNEFDIKPCEGCSGCEKKPHGMINCIRHADDFPVLLEKIYEADAVILSSPVYTGTPNGMIRVLGDRIGPYHDVEMLRLKGYEGADSPIDQRVFKRRTGAYITVGGSADPRYSSMGTVMMNQVMYPMALTIVDQMAVTGALMPGQCVEKKQNLSRAFELGAHVVLEHPLTGGSGQWRGEIEGLCPECHNDLFAIYPGSKTVYCGNCAIAGELAEGEDGSTTMTFTPEARTKSRFRLSKMGEHARFIVGGQSAEAIQTRRQQEKGELERLIKKYRTYTPTLIKPNRHPDGGAQIYGN